MKKIGIGAILAALVLSGGCVEEESVIITDRTGKEWDITHAVNHYDFDPERFQFGLGPYAIRPILDPVLLFPGQPGYPDDEATFRVVGVEIGGDVRAYRLSVLSRHEVVDEVFGGVHVAVTY